MEADDVLTLLGALEDEHVGFWLDGGWGVDCLLGEQTRPHGDLDLVVARPDVDRVAALLAAAGYAVVRDWLPTSLAFRDEAGREVDLHPVDLTADGGGHQVLPDGDRWHYAPPVTGLILGRSVPCSSAEDQLLMHTGYEPRPVDHQDVRRLADRFGLPVPAPFDVRPESGLSDDDFSPVWEDDDRPRIPRVAGEREALTAYLEHYRATLAMKCGGLTTEQAGRRSMPPSTMSLHGVVRHLASVERWWFQQNFERRDVPMLHPGSSDFEPPPDADLESDLAAWRAECAVSREILAAHGLDDTARPLDWHEDVDLRWLVLRMIAEYAQHCGHADLLREAVDGRTGS